MFRLNRIFFVLCILSISACTSSTGRIIRIDAPSEFVQNPLWGFNQLMSELGYKHLDLLNPETGQPVSVVEKYGEYRMLFAATDDADLRVSVHINEQGGKGKLILYREGGQDLDSHAMARYGALVEKLELKFGHESVHID